MININFVPDQLKCNKLQNHNEIIFEKNLIIEFYIAKQCKQQKVWIIWYFCMWK